MTKTKQATRSTTIVIFGASGDLTHRKLIPALYNNFLKQRLPEGLHILGVARREWSDEEFREGLHESIVQNGGKPIDEKAWSEFAKMIGYFQGNFDVPDDFLKLKDYLKRFEQDVSELIYYLATAPDYYGIICENLSKAGMTNEEGGCRRIIIEKPFGSDLKSAEELNKQVHAAFGEDQVYRIDHYLGKETAQNILFLRFANTIFEPVWNRRYISNVQITVAETVDVSQRIGYFDQAGIMRDMFQNHLLQLLSLATMEPPASLKADAIRNEKVKLLGAIRPILLEDTVRAQYEGYRASSEATANSSTPTFAALKLYIDNWRWKGVPFYLRSGKAMGEKSSSIIIEFQAPPDVMFNLTQKDGFRPNMLTICIQPNEGIHLRFETKVPDSVNQSRSVHLDFNYKDAFSGVELPDAYERLLLDVLNGDASLFTRSDGIENSWRLIDPIIAGWEAEEDAPPLVMYKPGCWGPEESGDLLSRDGFLWQMGCGETECELDSSSSRIKKEQLGRSSKDLT